MIPVTTRLEAVIKDGLVPTLRRLLGAGIPAIVLEAPAPDRALELDLRALRELRAPIVGAIAPVAPATLGTIASADADVARAAASAVRATAAAVAPFGA